MSTQEPDETLAEAFWAVARQLRQMSRESLAPWDVSPSQSRAVRVLAHHGPVRLRDLAERLHIAPRSATEVVDDLEQRDLVERQPDPDDRRAILVRLTPKGTEVVEAMRAAKVADADAYFSGLDDADRADLVRILRTLRAND
ncbi:MarR family transcriptional regulator [Kribbella sp. NBC_01245]|uniref:MarR family winged helix-turn-helix transcriptional regulator n=1 Tax=Kribbella sp. NBC_01245 TaxID=2903578 RepID=UPI002E29ED76|nr:MarR family transcriptional regulator [Kribbella sp. NBC_01245]